MLYMTVSTHGPNTCPGVHEEFRQKALSIGPKMEEVASAHGCNVEGTWVARTSHTHYTLVDAPDAHAVESLIMELGIQDWNVTTIQPVLTIEEAMKELVEQ